MTPTRDAPGVQLYQDDCRNVLPHLAGIDAVVTDPPYGIQHKTNYKRFSGGMHDKRNDHQPILGDEQPFDPSPWLDFPKVVLWGANCFSDRLPMGSWLVWCKKPASKLGKFMGDCELAWQKSGHGTYLFHHVWDGFCRETEQGKPLHPTQKPVALMRWCIERLKLKPGSTILDPFMGSAPVALATMDLGHNYIGIEREPTYFDIAVNRINDHLREPVSRAGESGRLSEAESHRAFSA